MSILNKLTNLMLFIFRFLITFWLSGIFLYLNRFHQYSFETFESYMVLSLKEVIPLALYLTIIWYLIIRMDKSVTAKHYDAIRLKNHLEWEQLYYFEKIVPLIGMILFTTLFTLLFYKKISTSPLITILFYFSLSLIILPILLLNYYDFMGIHLHHYLESSNKNDLIKLFERLNRAFNDIISYESIKKTINLIECDRILKTGKYDSLLSDLMKSIDEESGKGIRDVYIKILNIENPEIDRHIVIKEINQ